METTDQTCHGYIVSEELVTYSRLPKLTIKLASADYTIDSVGKPNGNAVADSIRIFDCNSTLWAYSYQEYGSALSKLLKIGKEAFKFDGERSPFITFKSFIRYRYMKNELTSKLRYTAEGIELNSTYWTFIVDRRKDVTFLEVSRDHMPAALAAFAMFEFNRILHPY